MYIILSKSRSNTHISSVNMKIIMTLEPFLILKSIPKLEGTPIFEMYNVNIH